MTGHEADCLLDDDEQLTDEPCLYCAGLRDGYDKAADVFTNRLNDAERRVTAANMQTHVEAKAQAWAEGFIHTFVDDCTAGPMCNPYLAQVESQTA